MRKILATFVALAVLAAASPLAAQTRQAASRAVPRTPVTVQARQANGELEGLMAQTRYLATPGVATSPYAYGYGYSPYRYVSGKEAGIAVAILGTVVGVSAIIKHKQANNAQQQGMRVPGWGNSSNGISCEGDEIILSNADGLPAKIVLVGISDPRELKALKKRLQQEKYPEQHDVDGNPIIVLRGRERRCGPVPDGFVYQPQSLRLAGDGPSRTEPQGKVTTIRVVPWSTVVGDNMITFSLKRG